MESLHFPPAPYVFSPQQSTYKELGAYLRTVELVDIYPSSEHRFHRSYQTLSSAKRLFPWSVSLHCKLHLASRKGGRQLSSLSFPRSFATWCGKIRLVLKSNTPLCNGSPNGRGCLDNTPARVSSYPAQIHHEKPVWAASRPLLLRNAALLLLAGIGQLVDVGFSALERGC